MVRLTSHHRKLTVLQSMLDDARQRGADTMKLQKTIRSIIAERDNLNKLWVASFKNGFRFASVFFVYDTTSQRSIELRRGAGCLLDDSLHIQGGAVLPDLPTFGAGFGQTDNQTSGGASVDALLLRGTDFRLLGKPFPYATPLNNLRFVFNKMIQSPTSEKNQTRDVVRKLQKKLDGFLKKAVKKE